MPPAIRPDRMPLKWAAVALVATFASGPAGAAGVYKWTDTQGRIHYDDNNVLEPQLTLESLKARGIPAREEATTPQDFINAVQHRCELARARFDSYRSATTLEGQDPAGNGYVMSPRQVQIEIAIAGREQTRYCAPGAAERLYREPPPAANAQAKITPVERR
jgi:hypothetical protein